MGLRGPLKIVDKDFRPDPARENEPAPRMPAGLSPAAKAEWRRVARPLHRLGLLTELDRKTLGMYCEAVARYERCQAYLAEHGETHVTHTGAEKPRPEYYVMMATLKEIRNFIALFGLSPSARIRLQVEQPGKPDEMENLLD